MEKIIFQIVNLKFTNGDAGFDWFFLENEGVDNKVYQSVSVYNIRVRWEI